MREDDDADDEIQQNMVSFFVSGAICKLISPQLLQSTSCLVRELSSNLEGQLTLQFSSFTCSRTES